VTVADEEWVAAARGIVERFPGRRALDELEWDAVGDFRDDDTRVAFASLFRAQGRALGATPALGVLVANRSVGSSTTDTRLTAVTRARVSGPLVEAIALAGFDDASVVIVEVPGPDGAVAPMRADRSAWTVGTDGPGAFDPLAATSVRIALADLDRVDDPAATRARSSGARSLARSAIAHEILGACDQLMELAVTYARDRHQFGAPIGSFQAVSHLLADAEVQVRALRDACATSLARSGADGPDPRETLLLKGLAGQTGRTVSQHTLQVFGGIGFTWEHGHHRYSRRMLTLDAIYGSVEEMRRQAVIDLQHHGILRTSVI
jgi:hypothetical protein